VYRPSKILIEWLKVVIFGFQRYTIFENLTLRLYI